MDIRDIDSLTFAGATLSTEERACLGPAITQRKLQEGLQEVLFWGRISGIERDYFIVYGFEPSKDYPKKKYYFCTSGNYTLQALPDLDEEYTNKAAGITGAFRGDPTWLYGEEPEEEEELEEEDDEEAESKSVSDDEAPPKRPQFAEIHRLAQTVAAIDKDTAVVPRGAWLVDAQHYVMPNAAFSGLALEDAQDLRSYYHLRAPEALARKSLLERRELVASTDFLDPLVDDSPLGTWVLRVDVGEAMATLRSLAWPGYYAYAEVGGRRFGGAYFGTGQRNVDLAFML